MIQFRKSVSLIAIAASLSLLATGCETKVAQCNKLTKVANAASTEFQEMGKDQKADKVEQLKKAADRLDQYIKDMDGIELKDEKLVGYKGRFNKMYGEIRDASRALVTAAQAKDVAGTKSAFEKMMTGVKQETPLVTEVNQYCQAK